MHISAGGSAAVESQPTPHRATLRVQSEALVASPAMSDYLHHRFGRILTGLSRQLRASLEHDVQKGEYAIAIALCDERTRIALRSILAVLRPNSGGGRRKTAFRADGATPGHALLIEADIKLGRAPCKEKVCQ